MYLHNTETYNPPNTQRTRNPNVYIMDKNNDPNGLSPPCKRTGNLF